MIQEEGELAKIFNVSDRTTKTLGDIIEQHCEEGSNIHSDGWKAYQSIDWNRLGMIQYRHIHTIS